MTHVAMQTLDVYGTQPLKAILQFKLHPASYPEITNVVATHAGPIKVDFFPVFRKGAARAFFSRNSCNRTAHHGFSFEGELQPAINISALRLSWLHVAARPQLLFP